VTVLVDSDVIIEVLRARDQDLLVKWASLSGSSSGVLCSPVSVAEIWAGARTHEHEAIRTVFDRLACATIDAATGRKAGDYLRMYQRSHSLGIADALIAASAFMNHAAVWTRNRKHYPMKELSFF
jgi:predicted nucleic acid-binding protein